MRVGVDLGGTKIEAVALSDDGTILVRERVPTPRDYRSTIDAVSALVHSVERAAGARGSVGIGIPGAVSPATGLVKNANSVWLIGHPLAADLAERLARPVRVMNDANCFALSEAADGAGRGADVVFGVILGTGVGGGIVVGGRALLGANLIAGEWGHNPLPWPRPDELPGPACYCGKTGCVETWLSGPGFERDHHHDSGREWSASRVARAAHEGDAVAIAALQRYHDRLARALAALVNVLDPDVVVLGGGMSNIQGLGEAASALLPRYVFSDTFATRVLRNVHGDSSGVRGAAWLWPLEEGTPRDTMG